MRKNMYNSFGCNRYFRRKFKFARFATDPSAEAGEGSEGTNEGGGGAPSSNEGNEGEKHDDYEAQIAELKRQLATVSADRERIKNSNDKLAKQNGELTKKNREMMSTEQLEKEAQEERERRFAEMEKEIRVNKYSKRSIALGMTEAEADTFAATLPELEDANAFFETLDKFIKAKEKTAGENAIQQLLKDRPDIHAGTGDANKDDTAMQIAKRAISSRNGGNINEDILKNFF